MLWSIVLGDAGNGVIGGDQVEALPDTEERAGSEGYTAVGA